MENKEKKKIEVTKNNMDKLQYSGETLSNDKVQVKSDIKISKERQYKCKNKMLECINSYENLSVNGLKDSRYNDLIAFENHFNEWDSNLIVLEKINYGHEGGENERPYVYHAIEGIFDNIGMFARRLQKILPFNGSGLTIKVMDFGGVLNISIYDGGYTPFSQPTYVARQYKLNQIDDTSYKEGHKWHITKI